MLMSKEEFFVSIWTYNDESSILTRKERFLENLTRKSNIEH